MKNLQLDRRTKYSQSVMKSALIELLETKDLDAVTVTDICKAADVNRGTFYRYYKDVRDLLSQMEDEFLDGILVIFENYGEDTANGLTEEYLEKVIKNALAVVVENKEFVELFQRGGNDSRVINGILTRIKPQFLEGYRSQYPQLSEEEVEYVFEYMLGGSTNIIVKWMNDGMRTSKTQIQNIWMELMRRTLTF